LGFFFVYLIATFQEGVATLFYNMAQGSIYGPYRLCFVFQYFGCIQQSMIDLSPQADRRKSTLAGHCRFQDDHAFGRDVGDELERPRLVEDAQAAFRKALWGTCCSATAFASGKPLISQRGGAVRKETLSQRQEVWQLWALGA
jgi:hypothetical protein